MGMTTIIEDSIQRQYRTRARDFWKQIAWHTALIIVTFFLLLPVIFVISTSLKKAGTELTYPIEWIPDPIVWQNYITAMTLPGLPFPLFIKNTVIITVLIMSGDVITTSMAGFAFARLRFPLRDKIFILVVSTMMLPYAVTMLPTFLLFSELNMVDTFTPLWIRRWFATSAFNVFLFRQYFRTIPYELDEAARMDGAGNWRIWLQVLMPLSQPVIATVAIFSFILGWTDFLDPLIYINSMEKRTVALGLSAFVDVSYQTSFVYMMAATVLTTLPVMAVFLAFQRYFTRGITLTGLGGR